MASNKNKSVIGLVSTEAEASRIVDELRRAGFSSDDVSALFPDKQGTRDFAHEKNTKAPEGAVTGAGAGGVLGGGLGLLAGIGAIAIPGLGPFIAAGPIMAALSGAAVGATVGGITGALIGLGIPELEAKRYESKVKDGNILLSVHVENGDEQKKAKEILERSGATDVTAAGEQSVPSSRGVPSSAGERGVPSSSRAATTRR
jgi:heat induced stress protein YflT